MGADANTKDIGLCTTVMPSESGVALKPEDQFDLECTTLNTSIAQDVMDEKTPHDQQLQKLKEIGTMTPILPSQIGTDFNFKREIVWINALGFLALHICCVIGLVLIFTGQSYLATSLYSLMLVVGSGLGVTMGAHRLWSHRSFKAKLGLKLFLLWLHTLAGQNCLYVWVRDHRQHHKYSDTDADPHNANRGFFFSHVGWLMSRKHPKVLEYGKKIDMSDLEADPWIMFQKRHYKVLYTIFALLGPTSIPVLCWGESPIIALFTAFFARAVIQLNATWLVNSAAHLYGTRPYDKTIFPVESMVVALFSVGEGWHNYHHAFPWDYRASELGTPLNFTGFLIDILAKYGVVYDRKEATHNMVKYRVLRTGDDSHHTYGTDEGRSAFTTLFNMWKHPLNPTYNSIHSVQPKVIPGNGYALACDELSKNERDEEILTKENAELEKNHHPKTQPEEGSSRIIKKLVVDKTMFSTLMRRLSTLIPKESIPSKTDFVSGVDSLNNNDVMNNNSYSAKNKSHLNFPAEDLLLARN